MKIGILLPCAPGAPRGNSTTAARLVSALERSGHEVSLEAAEGTTFEGDGFELLIALHAFKSGPTAVSIAKKENIPVIILFTGTDLNGQPSEEELEVVAQAQVLVTLGNAAARRVRDLFPNCGDKVSVIPQAVSPLPEHPGPRPEIIRALPPDAELILLPTGIRSIKDPARAITALAPMVARRPLLQLWILGEEMEQETATEVRNLCQAHPFATWLGPIPRAQLAPLFRRAQVVLSTSKSEGGAPNALLEAGLMGRPILATDIPAHREFPGASCLFGDDQSLRRKLGSLLDNHHAALLESAARREEIRHGRALAREAAAWSGLIHPFGH
ncbi:MAG: glycosyltransferase family 4 protein [Planctomycetota bacterium]|nr:glycosyltransferase family 4 protein [Planctomycetota bacterium]